MHHAERPRISFQSESALAFAALVAGNVALAFGPVFVRLASSEAQIGPVAAGFWRLLFAVPVLVLLTRVTGQGRRRPGMPMLAMVAFAGLFFAADLGVWHLGILRTKLANATLLGNVATLLFPLYGFVVARAWPSRWQGAALLMATLGAALLMGQSYELSPQYLAGDLLCLLSGILYTCYLILIDRARGTLQPLPLLTLSTIAGLLPLLVLARLLGETVWPQAWWPLVALALSSQVIGQGLLVYAIGHVRPLLVGLTFLLQPIVAAAMGWGVYGEALSLTDLIGAGAVAAAIVLVRRPAAPKAPPAG